MSTRKPPTTRFLRVAEGIYRDSEGGLFERPWIKGRRTWRKLASLTLKDAREELAARRSDQKRSTLGLAANPYERPQHVTVNEVLDLYVKSGMPSARGRGRSESSKARETNRLQFVRAWWGSRHVSEINFKLALEYGEYRQRTARKGFKGRRTADMELQSLVGALKNALRLGLISANPLAGDRPKFTRAEDVRHCRDTMPASSDELHQLAAYLFHHPQSEALGWQLLIEAFTGLRTSEALTLRTDAQGEDAGAVDGTWLWVRRSKGGINPYVEIHDPLADCLRAHAHWKKQRFPNSPWFFPSLLDRGQLPVTSGALGNALERATKRLKLAHRTSHGLRAFYVTVRRSQGYSDARIAAEIGDATGAAIVAQTYGAVPPNWRGKDAMTWLPKSGEPAWARWRP